MNAWVVIFLHISPIFSCWVIGSKSILTNQELIWIFNLYSYITYVIILIIFIVPTMKKLVSYLEEVLDWEKFAYQLLPEEKEYLVEVWSLWQ